MCVREHEQRVSGFTYLHNTRIKAMQTNNALTIHRIKAMSIRVAPYSNTENKQITN